MYHQKRIENFSNHKTQYGIGTVCQFPNETLVLLINYEDKSYYDDQIIKVPSNKCAKQLGTYQYETKMEMQKTVPVVVIE